MLNTDNKYFGSILQTINKLLWFSALFLLFYFVSAAQAQAASLALSPSTGVYTANGTFSVRIIANTAGKPINASEGTLTFNPRELSVVSVNRAGSIFNLWVAEPSFSNSAGTISFSGGLTSGYSGKTGTIMNVTFRAAGAGTTKVSFKNGSILANDGRGTNILTSMNGGTYTIQAKSVAPEAEVIEYIAPANTPARPVISSKTHGDENAWFTNDKAELNWSLPNGVIAVRTLLNTNPTSVPTKVYDNPISHITLADLDEGVSYFHLQFKNSDGWGKVNHYRLAIDTEKPTSIDITQPADANLTSPIQTLVVTVVDETSAVKRFKVKIDAAEPFEVTNKTGSSSIVMPELEPGYHTVIIEAFDAAGNSIIGTYSFTIQAFDRPVFIEYPTEMNEEVIPVIIGMTRPQATVEIFMKRLGSDEKSYTVTSDESGKFIFIPEGRLSNGVYELTARATDEFGAVSEWSETVRIAVQRPGYLQIGSLLVSVLSVVVPLLVLVLALGLGLWYFVLYIKRLRKKVTVESFEALAILRQEFAILRTALQEQKNLLQSSRKTKKLTKAESGMIEVFEHALDTSQEKVEKEIKDITELTKREKS